MRPSIFRLTFVLAAAGSATLLAADQGVALAGSAGAEGRRVRIGGIGAGFTYMRGNPWWPGYPYGAYGPWGPPVWSLYDPFWYSPWVHPMLYPAWRSGQTMGEIKIESPDKQAAVYIDDAFAGTVESLKKIQLKPGVYRLAVRDFRGGAFEQRVYVLSGKQLRLRPHFRSAQTEVIR